MSDNDPTIQQIQARESFVRQHINEAYETIWNDKADPPIQPTIQLKEGWQNGNIKVSVASPTGPSDGHTWDVWLQVSSITSDSWEAVTNIYVRVPGV